MTNTLKTFAGGRLSRRIQLQIGLVIALAIIAVTLLSYQLSMVSLRAESLDALKRNLEVRAQLESETFLQAQQNTVQLRQEFQHRLEQLGDSDPQDEFDRWFSRSPDGLIRVRPELDNHQRLPSIYIRKQVELNAKIRREVLTAFQLLSEWGPPMTSRYYSTYIDLPAIALIMFSPSVNWGREANAESNNFDYPPVRDSAPERNPERSNIWTEVYFDDKAGVWMLSTVTPMDLDGHWIGTLSQDISVEQLLRHTQDELLPGTYNMLVDGKGKLLAHPRLMQQIRSSAGSLELNAESDPQLHEFANAALQSPDRASILTSADGQHYLGVARISGPGWYFISVMPKSLLEEKAFGSAQRILLAGLIGLIIQLMLLAYILRRQVARPLSALRQATHAIAQGDLSPKLDTQRDDELGRLASSFVDMAQRLRERDETLQQRASELEHEIHEREVAETARQRLADRLSIAAEVAYLGVWEWDISSLSSFWDAQTYRLYGLEPFSIKAEAAIWLDLVVPDDRKVVLTAIENGRHGPQTRHELEYRLQWPNGEVHTLSCIFHVTFDVDGKAIRLTGVQLDITERKLSEERILHMATHDGLTGLANRVLLSDRLQQAIAVAQRDPRMIALLFIDLDHFKQINDTLGHSMGDELLKHVGEKISMLMRQSDTLARIGGDEFIVLLPSIRWQGESIAVAQKIIAALDEEIVIDGVSFNISPSIGISIYPSDGADAESLLRNADIAMYRAKASGRNTYQCYTADMGERASEIMRLEGALRKAIENKEFLLYFQPKIDAVTLKPSSAEVLLRWNRPGFGLQSPATFIPFAEERNLIGMIDQFVLQETCRQLHEWRQQGVALQPLAINLSSNCFAQDSLVGSLLKLLETYGLPAELIKLEVTEGLFLKESDTVQSNLAALRSMGVKISIDDFGTGYSSLSYLHRFPVDELKIDRSFVNNILDLTSVAPLVNAIIGIGHSLNLSVVAEGVETSGQADYLRQHGCEELQGYHFYRPMPAGDYLKLLSTNEL